MDLTQKSDCSEECDGRLLFILKSEKLKMKVV